MATLEGECQRRAQRIAGASGRACSFQRTFCDACARELAEVCPNCAGALEPRA